MFTATSSQALLQIAGNSHLASKEAASQKLRIGGSAKGCGTFYQNRQGKSPPTTANPAEARCQSDFGVPGGLSIPSDPDRGHSHWPVVEAQRDHRLLVQRQCSGFG